MLGLSVQGPVAGGLWSLAQSAAMGNTASALAFGSSVVTAAAAAAIPVAAVATVGEYMNAQTHTLDQTQPSESADGDWVLVWHNWVHGVHTRRFETLEGALECSKGGKRLRRMVVCLTSDDNEVVNEHGQANPWHEVCFQGENVLVDNAMRRALREYYKL